MQRFFRLTSATLAALAACLLLPATARAQGMTTGAIGGSVTDSTGAPLNGATIKVFSPATGLTRTITTRSNGRYVISGLEIDDYTVSVAAIGYRPEELEHIKTQLSTTARADFMLAHQAVQLQALVATAPPASAEFAPTRTGAQTFVSDSSIRRLPTLNRQLQDFVRLTPQVTISPSSPSSISIAGQNNRYNAIQVDGTDQNDRFGLGTDGELGGQAGGRGITLEAVKEYDVVLAPYNVTQGGFTGGLVNAVTKNGTNTVQADAFYTFRNQDIASGAPIISASTFSIKQFGGSIGGPIIKDKLHFFVAGELNQASKPAAGPYLGQPASIVPGSPINQAQLDSITTALNAYGIPAGSAGLVNNGNPIANFDARIDYQISDKSRLVFRNIYDNSKSDAFSRSQSTFDLTSNQFRLAETDNSFTTELFTNMSNGGTNEAQIGWIRQRFARALTYTGPQIRINSLTSAAGAGTYSVIAGADSNSHVNALNQDFYEAHDDYTFPFAGNTNHLVTIGTRSDVYKVSNAFEQNVFGSWAFNGIDSLIAGNTHSYAVGVIRNGVNPLAQFTAANLAFYAQDQWTVTSRFNLTYGLRAEAPHFFDHPAHTDSVFSDFGRNTDVLPGGWNYSPRLGFNLDVDGNQTTQIRGGVGLFTGIPPYVWLSNMFTNSGQGLAQLTCASAALPAPTFTPGEVGPGNNPSACANGAGLNTGLIGNVNTVDPDYHQAQNLRMTLGGDHRLPWNVVGTVDGNYTRAIYAPFMQNLELTGPQGKDPYGRVLYGTISATGVSSPALKHGTLYSGGVYDLENSSADYSWGVAVSLRKRFTNSLEASVAYSHQRSYSVQDFTSSVASSNFRNGEETAGLLSDKSTTAPSAFDQPNHIVASLTYTAPWKKLPTDISFFYQGFSGTAFTYVYGKTGSASGDLNADGVSGNDPVYVPSDVSQITFVSYTGSVGGGASRTISPTEQADSLASFLKQMPCVNASAGQIMARRSCSNPWYNTLDVSVRQSLPSVHGHTLTLQADMFNFLNFLNSSWGQYRTAGSFQNNTLFTQVGMNTDGTPTVRFDPNLANYNNRFPIAQVASNFWQAQFTLRYSF
ncbi:MAG TPA: carboxypeptidase regulatory-like domain-containing protein [Gemmatimonadales bacterium]|nr:carboxypeptidase regulatory-like domain-containing protein [Gemmatimonadales bacterium]